MIQYHFYTGSYLAESLQEILNHGNTAPSNVHDWHKFTVNAASSTEEQAVHVLFYESLLKAFRHLHAACVQEFSDTQVYAIMHYALISLCASILESGYDDYRFQNIHLIYSSGEKLSIKGSARSNEQYISKMVDEINYRFYLEGLVKNYQPKAKTQEAYNEVFDTITEYEMLPSYQVSQCIEIMKWCDKHPYLSLEESDEAMFFQFYRSHYQGRDAQQHFHFYQEERKMEQFLNQMYHSQQHHGSYGPTLHMARWTAGYKKNTLSSTSGRPAAQMMDINQQNKTVS